PARLPEHYAFLRALRAEGSLALSGPFDDASGGAYLLDAASRAEAESIARRDPLHVHGCSAFELRGWRIQAA
ncbi:YciI family protein, partial [Acinetobacter baumannii]